jgi:SAM-dependent methyltransferase
MTIEFQWQPQDMESLMAACDRNDIVPLIDKYLPRGCTVLEAGCGVGQWVRYLNQRGFRATGVEIVPETIDMALRHWPGLDLRVGDVANMPFPENSFDAALSLGVVEHWPEGPTAPLKELRRVLRKGGIALITVPCLNSIREWKRRLWFDEAHKGARSVRNTLRGTPTGHTCFRLHRRFKYRVFPAVGTFFEYRMRPGEFRSEVEQAGFEILDHQPVGIIDGVYHDLNPFGVLMKFSDWTFYPTRAGLALHRWLARKPFRSPHMQAIIARK